MSKSRDQLIEYLKQIDITDKVVLDAGSGSKEHWARNWTKGEPKEYKTLDIDKSFGVTILGDLNIVPANLYESIFDIIFCLETLEHLWNPLNAIKFIYKILKTDSTAYFSTPLINPYHDTVDYARYTDEWYEKVLTEVGFKDIEITPRLTTDGLPYLLQFYKVEGLRLSKIRAGQEAKMAEIGYIVKAIK